MQNAINDALDLYPVSEGGRGQRPSVTVEVDGTVSFIIFGMLTVSVCVIQRLGFPMDALHQLTHLKCRSQEKTSIL